MFDSNALASNIAQARKRLGLSQEALAHRLYVTAQSISKWEHGESLPDVAKLCKLAEIFGVGVDALLATGQQDGKRYMVAIDGGGTKTEFLLLDAQGIPQKRVLLGGSNPNTVGISQTCALLQNGIGQLYVPDGQIVGIFAGIAGCGAESYSTAVANFLKEHYPTAAVCCDTDVLNVLGCVPEAENCVLAICGTGSVVYGCQDGRLNRLGGWGYLLDSDGSGFGIGKDALTAALAQNEGLGPATVITDLLEHQLGSPVWEQIGHIYAGGQTYIASFAPLVFDACQAGDAVAQDILCRHFSRIGQLIDSAFSQYACGQTVILAGGLMQRKELILPCLANALTSDIQITVPDRPQIFGACVQCCKLCGVSYELLQRTFDKEYKKMGARHHA